MDRIGAELLSARKANALGKTSSSTSSLGELSLEGHDLLTALVRANMDTDLPETQRMSDEDVLARESPFDMKTRAQLCFRGSNFPRRRAGDDKVSFGYPSNIRL